MWMKDVNEFKFCRYGTCVNQAFNQIDLHFHYCDPCAFELFPDEINESG